MRAVLPDPTQFEVKYPELGNVYDCFLAFVSSSVKWDGVLALSESEGQLAGQWPPLHARGRGSSASPGHTWHHACPCRCSIAWPWPLPQANLASNSGR